MTEETEVTFGLSSLNRNTGWSTGTHTGGRQGEKLGCGSLENRSNSCVCCCRCRWANSASVGRISDANPAPVGVEVVVCLLVGCWQSRQAAARDRRSPTSVGLRWIDEMTARGGSGNFSGKLFSSFKRHTTIYALHAPVNRTYHSLPELCADSKVICQAWTANRRPIVIAWIVVNRIGLNLILKYAYNTENFC